LSGSPFIIACGGVTVASNATLTIQPGVVVKFQLCSASGFIAVNGSLVANGTPTQIVFTSVLEGTATPPSPGNWNGIFFNAGATGSISNVVLRYSYNGLTIATGSSSPTVSNNSLTDNFLTSLRITGAGTNQSVSGHTFSRNNTGLAIESAAPTVSGNSFDSN